MSESKVKQKQVRLLDHSKRDVRTQFGALCWRVKAGKPQVLLITSRNSKRWIVPKGWPKDRATPSEAALDEAWEEAGVKGRVSPDCIGIYSYHKEFEPEDKLPCVVAMFPVKVKKLSTDYPEKSERRRKWFSPKKASKLVAEPELAAILASFDHSIH